MDTTLTVILKHANSCLRHWRLTAEGREERVDGDGVIGVYPLLREGSYRRDSGPSATCVAAGDDEPGVFSYQSIVGGKLRWLHARLLHIFPGIDCKTDWERLLTLKLVPSSWIAIQSFFTRISSHSVSLVFYREAYWHSTYQPLWIAHVLTCDSLMGLQVSGT